MTSFTSISHVNFGDNWSATSHNLLLDNAEAPFTSVSQYRVLYYPTTTTISGIALSAGQFLKGSATAPAGAYPPGIWLPIEASIPPMSGINAAALELVESSSGATAKPVFYQLRFDASTDEGRMWVFRLNNQVGTPVLKFSYKMASANTSKNIVMVAQVAAISDGDTSVSAKAFASANSATVSVPDTADVQDEGSITLTNADSMASADWLCLLLYRDADNASDNAAGDAIVNAVEFMYG